MSRDTEAEIDNSILEAATADYLDVWYVVQVVEDVLDTAEGDLRARDLALDAIERILLSGKLTVGRLVPPGEFVATQESPGGAVARIREEAGALGRPPNVGEIAWFRQPELLSRYERP